MFNFDLSKLNIILLVELYLNLDFLRAKSII